MQELGQIPYFMSFGCSKSTDVSTSETIDISILFKKTNLILKLFKHGGEKRSEGKIFLELRSTKFNHLKENMLYFCLSRVSCHVTHSLYSQLPVFTSQGNGFF